MVQINLLMKELMVGEILAIRLKKKKKTKEHITNMNAWIDLEIRLLKNKTIDKNVQEQINKDKIIGEKCC